MSPNDQHDLDRWADDGGPHQSDDDRNDPQTDQQEIDCPCCVIVE